jgi:hypothetical protein
MSGVRLLVYIPELMRSPRMMTFKENATFGDFIVGLMPEFVDSKYLMNKMAIYVCKVCPDFPPSLYTYAKIFSLRVFLCTQCMT